MTANLRQIFWLRLLILLEGAFCFLFEKVFEYDINMKVVLLVFSVFGCLLVFLFWKREQKEEAKSSIKQQNICGFLCFTEKNEIIKKYVKKPDDAKRLS